MVFIVNVAAVAVVVVVAVVVTVVVAVVVVVVVVAIDIAYVAVVVVGLVPLWFCPSTTNNLLKLAPLNTIPLINFRFKGFSLAFYARY